MTIATAVRTPSRLPWIAVALAWLSSVAVLLIWLLGTSTGSLREQLKTWQFWSLESCAFLAALFAVYTVRELRHEFDKRDGASMAVLATLAVGLTVLVPPRTNRIFYDEQIYQSIGQNLADLRLAQVCNDGSVEYGRLECPSGEYNKQPYAYPHVLSVMYRLFGVHEGTAFAVNAVAMGATVAAVYLLVCVLFRDRDAAFFAGLLLALTPHQLVWSATAAVEPSASLALVLALLCAAHYAGSGGTAAAAAAAVMAAYAVQFRPESLLILPVIGLLVWPRLRRDLGHPWCWWIGLMFFGLVAIHVGHQFAVRHADWGTDAARFSLQYVPANTRVNGWFYLYDERFPMTFSLLTVLGLASRGWRRERVSMAMYFVLFFAIGLVFYAGSYNYGADVRYSLMTYPPLAVLGGLGAARLVRLISSLGTGVPVRALAVTALAFQFLWYAPLVRATTEEGWAARADVRFARSLVSELPRNAYVLTHNPGMFHLWGVNAGQMSRAIANPRYVTFLASRYTDVYVHWNFWCNVQDPVQQEFCHKAMAIGPVELVREYRERDQRFALYRLRADNE
jgi:4-amino-4-deoxy-L-arabinose transferase-like glycosyltransferase